MLFRHQLLDAGHDGGDRRDVEIALIGFVGVEGHLDVEGLFDGENGFHQAQAVDAKILECLVHGHVRRIKHGLVGDDLDHLVLDVHCGPPSGVVVRDLLILAGLENSFL